MSRRSGPEFGPKLALMATAAIASLVLTGCTTASAPRAEVSFNKAQVALEKGQTDKAIVHGEAAVLADPRNPAFRALLGAAYLEAGRYESAATSFGDALELGDTDARTVLSYSLAKTAVGDSSDALETLTEWESALDPADAGLAYALAGNAERGVHVLTNALRGGQNSAKMRQNLAYTYALAGNWRAARVMAAEDVPAGELDARLSDWAANARPEDHMIRVSKLLGIAPARDGGLPGGLALSNFPSQKQMVAEAEAGQPMDAAPAQVAAAPGKPSQTEALTFARGDDALAGSGAVETFDPTVAKIMAATGAAPKAAPSPAAAPALASAAPQGPRFISEPVAQKLPASTPTRVTAAPQRRATPAPAPERVASGPTADTHLVQLGSYVSREEAERGWNVLKRKFPQLREHDLMITKAEVNGKIYHRVAAAGFGRYDAARMCSTVKSKGRGCFAYAKTNPPKGAIDSGVRIAAR
ncbi:MAG: tetratricopeptide repeat protein [Erythrobacter sp.]